MSKIEANQLLRAARRQLASESAPGDHASRAEVAERTNAWLWQETGKRYELDAHYLAKMERGVVRWPNAAYRAGLRHVLGVHTDAELGFSAPRRSGGHAAKAGEEATRGSTHLGWDVASLVEAASDVTEDDLTVPRRRTVLTSETALTGHQLTGPLESFLFPVVMIDRGNGSKFTSDELDSAESLLASLRSWHAHSGVLARAAVVAQLDAHLRRLKEAPQELPETQRAFRIGAELAQVIASMSWDSGQHGTAQRYFVLATQLAHSAGEGALAAVALAALARQCFDLGCAVDGLEIVQLAQYCTRRTATPRLRAVLATRESWAHAQRGEVGAFRRAVGLAEDFHAEGEREVDLRTPTVRSFDAAELVGVIGARYRDLARVDSGYARTGQGHISRALELRDPSRIRNKIFDTIGLARAHLITREPDRSIELINQVLPLVKTHSSGRVGTKLQEFYSETAPFAGVREVHEARETIAEMTNA